MKNTIIIGLIVVFAIFLIIRKNAINAASIIEQLPEQQNTKPYIRFDEMEPIHPNPNPIVKNSAINGSSPQTQS